MRKEKKMRGNRVSKEFGVDNEVEVAGEEVRVKKNEWMNECKWYGGQS